MKTLKISLYALVTVALIMFFVVVPTAGARTFGLVSGWLWKSCWTLIGMIGATAVLCLGGCLSVLFFWRDRSKGAPLERFLLRF